jgi:hypothetical protein
MRVYRMGVDGMEKDLEADMNQCLEEHYSPNRSVCNLKRVQWETKYVAAELMRAKKQQAQV